jgi:hypothetical protein
MFSRSIQEALVGQDVLIFVQDQVNYQNDRKYMSVIGPKVTCHKCGQKLVIDTKGRVPIHDAKNTTIPCVGSLEKPRS